ncbi:helix-turn-helix domain-containing protein [Spirillospora albida]|uniref:helix-turn-helix domain-containing protein n=1 Tax=Spirillospora albida TaxID=58123 RepID=UPI00068F7B93|nr:helix-turn-helix transcriptional regulator [Spirillospora albida]
MSVPSGAGPVVLRAILTSELQRLRQERGATQDQVANALDWSTSKLIRIEGGAVGVSITDLHALLRFYGLGDGASEVAELTEIARGARKRGWWDLYKNDVPQDYLRYIGYEAGAATIRSVQPLVVPGLLQTEDYANAMTIEFVQSPPDRDIVVEVRIRRQEELFSRADQPQLHMVIDEAVLRRRVGGQRDPGIMPRQLSLLLEMLTRPNITIEVIPFSQGAHFGVLGGFTILEFADPRLTDVLYLERLTLSALPGADRDARIADYRAGYENLRKLVLPAEETAPFIEDVIASMA